MSNNLSLILNVHREGPILMQPTVKSLARSIQYAKDRDVNIEVIVVMDRSDPPTISYVKKELTKLIGNQIKYIDADVGDLGQARNIGINNASFNSVCYVDADDLFGESLIYECFRTLQKHPDKVVHPAHIVSFGYHNEIWLPRPTTDPAFDWEGIIEYNPFCSLSFVNKEITKKFPYRASNVGGGFGPEDWQWNMDTMGSGVNHITAPHSAYFYRRKLPHLSMAGQHDSSKSILDRSPILTNKAIARMSVKNYKAQGLSEPVKIEQPSIRRSKKTIAQKFSVVPRYLLIKTSPLVSPIFQISTRTKRFEQYMRIAFAELFSTAIPDQIPVQPEETPTENFSRPTVPLWLKQEWKTQHSYEHLLFPDKMMLSNIHWMKPQASEYSYAYWSLVLKMPMEADYVFLVPWLRDGGADLLTANYVKAILDINKTAKIVVIATSWQLSTTQGRLPKQVKFIQLDEIFLRQPFDRQATILSNILVQTGVKHVHLLNSELGYRMFESYALPLSKRMKLFMSLFSVDITPEGKRHHHALDSLPLFSSYITRVFTDNYVIKEKFIDWFSYPDSLFEVQYQPIDKLKKPQHKFNKPTLRILWAGRIDREKRPDILLAIAKECEKRKLPVSFSVYGSPVMDDNAQLNKIKRASYINYMGPFRKYYSLPLEKFDLFLLTSEYEGMPNTLLEATNSGLPVMAPDVGGIKELVNESNGFLVNKFDDVSQYIKLIEQILKDKSVLEKKWAEAYKLVQSRHSWDSFRKRIKSQTEYIK